ncbi:hypothetical protein J2T14_004144 [Paenibacillus harenae]|nr:hypothetical protein [Paenibacillus harenae]
MRTLDVYGLFLYYLVKRKRFLLVRFAQRSQVEHFIIKG